MIWEKKGGGGGEVDESKHVSKQHQSHGGAKGGWFVVTIIFYKQIRVTSAGELDLKHFNYLWVIESCFL